MTRRQAREKPDKRAWSDDVSDRGQDIVPFTPFHGGIGLLAKAMAPREFSFGLFCATQVAIDCESGYYLLRGEWPCHRFFHTFLGAGLLSLAVVFAVRPLLSRVLRALGRTSLAADLPRLDLDPAVSLRMTLISAAVGTLGHVIPDGIMHPDVRPFAPWSDANPFHGVVSLQPLHNGLVILGALGFLILLVRSGRRAES